ncbi:DUF4407 domain-containing protein [Vibrio vulnificus]|uniref:DUF4407 domain-containing protein n=1 Tax=Vibrio vulnificus TaxID=672 RepID=UPI0010295BD7|nr:DUF4407 domain-containing protein [Vibrio vulnificus]RZR24223.1 DUF4407 domain-containing protein [Vibrio vulnificus]
MKLLKLACGIARADYDIACDATFYDRVTIYSNAAMLVLLGILACVAWTAFWASFLPIGPAISLGMLVGLIVFLIDAAISASDWEMAGILRIAPPNKSYWVKITARAIIAFFLANATATGATMWLFGDTIEAHLQSKQIAKNAALEAEYVQRKKDLSLAVKLLSNEVEAKQAERAELQKKIEQAIAERHQANVRASNARIEAGRQIDGALPGYKAGPGALYRDEKRKEEEAVRLATSASEDIRRWEIRRKSLDDSIATLNTTINSKQTEYLSQALIQDEQKVRDPRWTPVRNDPLIRYIALDEILRDPEIGRAASKFSLLMTFVLLTLELSFLLIKVFCSPASVYMVRLIARTKRDAAAVSIEYARSIEDVRRTQPRGKLRVVGGEPEQPEGEH